METRKVTNANPQKAGIAMLKLHKADFKARKFTRNQGHFTEMKGLSQHNDIIISICVFYNITSKYTKQKLIEVNKDTEKLQRDFDVLLPAIDRKNRQKKKNQY